MISGRTTPFGVQIPVWSVVKALWNRKWMIAVVGTLLCALAIEFVRCLPAIYTAEAVVLVESQRIPETFVSATVTINLQDQLNNLSERVLGYARLNQIIKRLNLYEKERRVLPPEVIVRIMRGDIHIALERNVAPGRPGAFRISYRARNPEIAAAVTNLMASFFIDENHRSREVEATGTSEFLDGQLVAAKAELERQEELLSGYKLQHNGELPQQESGILATMGQLKVQLAGVQDSLSRARDNRVLLEAALAQLQAAESGGGASRIERESDGEAARIEPESEQIEARLAQLRVRYKDAHPEVRRALAGLARAKQAEGRSGASVAPAGDAIRDDSFPRNSWGQPAAAKASAQEPLVQRERTANLAAQITLASQTIERLTSEREQLTRDLADYQSRLTKLPVREQELIRITRDYEINKVNYQSLLSKKLAANVASEMERDQKSERFVLLDKAAVPRSPSSPRRRLYGTMGCLAALMFSVALGFVLEYRKGTLLGEWELPAAAPVLSRIPEVKAVPGGNQAKLAAPLFPFNEADERAFEQYRVLRTKLTQHPRNLRVIAVSSASAGDGKSYSSANLAGVLTLKPETQALLVDADFRTAGLSRMLGVEPSPGLSEVLSGECPLERAIVRLPGMPGLYFLPAGELGSRATDLLDSAAWRSLSDAFRTSFSFTVVDCAPDGPIADLDLIQATCDGVVLVTRPDHSCRQDLLQTVKKTPKLVGVVLNQYRDWFLWKTPNNYYYSRQDRAAAAANRSGRSHNAAAEGQ